LRQILLISNLIDVTFFAYKLNFKNLQKKMEKQGGTRIRRTFAHFIMAEVKRNPLRGRSPLPEGTDVMNVERLVKITKPEEGERSHGARRRRDPDYGAEKGREFWDAFSIGGCKEGGQQLRNLEEVSQRKNGKNLG